MLRSLVATALSYRLLVLLLAAVTAGLGIWAFVNLPVDAYPNIAQTQVKLILKAPGMTPEKFDAILARQTPDAAKRARADFVIPTDVPLEETRAAVRAVIACLSRPTGR